MDNKTVAAVIVTYNRKQMFQECIEAVLNQSYKCKRIIVVDNKSTDGTDLVIEELMKKQSNITCIFLQENTGGAGGFYVGMKQAAQQDFDYIWIMDDDTIPTANCLEKMVIAGNILQGAFSYLASTVRGIHNEPMNVPEIIIGKGSNGYSDALQYLKNGILEIGEATFVSLLIKVDATKKIGLPWPGFFLWGDDSEYTCRLTHFYGKAYIVGDSLAIHKREQSNGLSIFHDNNVNRIRLYYYFYRNSFIRIKAYGKKMELIRRLGHAFIDSWKCLFDRRIEHRVKKFNVIWKAIFDFMLKKYDIKSFNRRFEFEN